MAYAFNCGAWADAARFVGREALLADAAEALASPERFDGRRYIGRRRQGKTSMLRAVERLAAGVAGSPWVSAFLDLRATRTEAEAARALARQLRKLPGPPLAAPDSLSALQLDLADRAVEHPFRLLLLLDEAEALVPADDEIQADPELLLRVRRLARGLQTLQEGDGLTLRVFLASTRRLNPDQDVHLLELLQPLPVCWLGNLDEPAVDAMLQAAALPADAAAQVAVACGGHPYLLHVRGFALQRPGIDADAQIRTCLAHDFHHVLPAEDAWLSALARGGQPPPPETAGMLQALGYVRQQGASYQLREPVLAEWLLTRTSPPPAAAPPPPPPPPTPGPAPSGPVELSLVRAPNPSAASMGELRLTGRAPLNLGAQSWILLGLVAQNTREGNRHALRGEDLVYPLRLGLALCGVRHGVLIPKARYSDLRAQVGDLPLGDDARGEWLSGRYGYHLHEGLQLGVTDDVLGHLGLRRIDLLAAYARWEAGRRVLLDLLRQSRAGQKTDRRLIIALGPAPVGLFPEHSHLLTLRVTSLDDQTTHARLGPIPLGEPEALALRYWAEMDEEGEAVAQAGFEAWARKRGVHPAPPVTGPGALLDELGLRGGSWEHGGQKQSCAWAPDPGTAGGEAFVVPPRWLDARFESEAAAPSAAAVFASLG